QASGLISTIAYYVIMILISITSLNQAGIDTGAITSNFIIIIGSIFLAFALAFGLGAKDVLGNILAGLYTKKNFHVGQRIRVQDTEGVIERMDSINFILKTDNKLISIPIRKLVEEKVEIIDVPGQ
ncbi:MAG: mechanosensitive ion channel, partial [Chitinophagaceae bacterium]|nr:mechanosensitive ion channel [Chitinophagaceae bacterium]